MNEKLHEMILNGIL